MSNVKSRTLRVVMEEDGAEVEHVVELRLADQLRAELEGKAHGIQAVQNPIHLQSLFAWACLVRLELFKGRFAAFRDACLEVSDVQETDVDPTQPAASEG